MPASEERLSFISGFTGSAGFAFILQDVAGLFSDGRYTLQMAGRLMRRCGLYRAGCRPRRLAEAQDIDSARIGVDPRLVTVTPMTVKKVP